MLELVKMEVAPDVRMVQMVNAGLAALFELAELDRLSSGRLQLAVEEIFVYFVHCIQKGRYTSHIGLHLSYDQQTIRLRLERKGPAGELDRYFRPSQDPNRMVCNDFNALGLKLAHEMMDSIRYSYWPSENVHQFSVVYECRKPPRAKRKD